jgi:hypothetical protein
VKYRDPKQVSLYTVITLSIYALVWFGETREEIHATMNEKTIPTRWWFILPFGSYWWVWQYSAAAEKMSEGAIKATDTFLLFLVTTMAGSFVFNVVPDSFFESTAWLGFLGGGVLLNLALYSIFPAVMQNKYNKLDGDNDRPKDPLIS